VQVDMGHRMVYTSCVTPVRHLQALGLHITSLRTSATPCIEWMLDAYAIENLVMIGVFPGGHLRDDPLIMFVVLRHLDVTGRAAVAHHRPLSVSLSSLLQRPRS